MAPLAAPMLAHLQMLPQPTRWQPVGYLSSKPRQEHTVAELSLRSSGSFQPFSRAPGRAVAGGSTSVWESGFNARGKKTLEHPDFHHIQELWHPHKNGGKVPADFTHGSAQQVWLQCGGCQHGCGRRHEWQAIVNNLTRNGGRPVCPYCSSRGGSFCECRSVAHHPTLSREWHPDNPPPASVGIGSRFRALWTCAKKGHEPYQATCNNRSVHNTGCPACCEEARSKHHPPLTDRPDLVEEWVHKRNPGSPSEVSLGSAFRAWWKCSNPECGEEWQARVQERALKGSGCPRCRPRFGPKKFGSAEV